MLLLVKRGRLPQGRKMKTISGYRCVMRRSPGIGEYLMKVTVGCALVLSLFLSSVWANADRSGISWENLSQKEQSLLQRFRETWDQLPSTRQEQIRRGARRWETLTPAQRRRARIQFKRWKALSLKEKKQIRRRFKRFLQLSPKEREALQRRRTWFQNLSPERRELLRSEWDRLSPERRERLRDRLGIDRMRRRPRTDRQHLTR